MVAPAPIPYCGLPPEPVEIWSRWVLEPALLAVLLLVPAAVLHAGRQCASSIARSAFMAGWAVVAIALVSPLCALSVALFSMRATQHMLLLVVAAPLVAYALPQLLPGAANRISNVLSRPALAGIPALLFAVLLWGWHLPAPYEATFRSDLLYWAMHVSLLGAAVPLWMQLLQPNPDGIGLRTLLGFATFVQMGLLGAVLTLAPALLYGVHATTTQAWGLAPLADQQLGGLIMWVPGGSTLLLATLAGMRHALREPVPVPGRFD